MEEAEAIDWSVRTAMAAVGLERTAKEVVDCMKNAGRKAGSTHDVAVGSHSSGVKTFDLDLAPAAPFALHFGAYFLGGRRL